MASTHKIAVQSMSTQPASNRRVLHSWKEISAYAGRGVRTIQRYEMQLGFPVHRPAGSPRSAVLAFSDEVDAWLSRSPMRNQANNATAIDELYLKAKVGKERALSVQERLKNTALLLEKLNTSMLKAMEHRSRLAPPPHRCLLKPTLLRAKYAFSHSGKLLI